MTRLRTVLGWSALAATAGLLLFWGVLEAALRAGTPVVTSPLQAARSTRLAATLAELTAQNGRQSQAEQWAAAKYLTGRFATLGYRTRIEKYQWKGESWPDVVATSGAALPQQGAVLLMAHLDSISGDPKGRAPGADDDGSGIAVLLELARTLRERSVAAPVVFAIFSNEETGNSGSQAFVARLRRKEIRLRAAINVDTVGYPRPRQLFDWSTLAAHHTWEGRLQALREQFNNLRLALHHAPEAFLVAGRARNRTLVAQVKRGFATGGGLEVVSRTRDVGG